MLALVAACCVLAGMGGRLYYVKRYVPVRDVQPILRLLDEGGLGNVERGTLLVRGLVWTHLPNGKASIARDPNRTMIRGAGAEEVKRALLRAMAKESDPETLDRLLTCVVGAREDGNIVFQGDKEWRTIGTATDRHNADPKMVLRYFLTKDTNGVTVLGVGSRMPIP